MCLYWQHLSLFLREMCRRSSLCCSLDGLRAVLTLETEWQDPVSYCWAAEVILPRPHSSLQKSPQLWGSLASVPRNYWVFINISPSAEAAACLSLPLSVNEETGAPGRVQFLDWWRAAGAPVRPDNLSTSTSVLMLARHGKDKKQQRQQQKIVSFCGGCYRFWSESLLNLCTLTFFIRKTIFFVIFFVFLKQLFNLFNKCT